MSLIIFSIFGIFLFGSSIEKSKNKMEYYHNILWTIGFVFLTFCNITDYRGIIGKIILIVLLILLIITNICSNLIKKKISWGDLILNLFLIILLVFLIIDK
ncbi:hypothetical protein SAMN02910355_1526 [Terrisporobacter glycolicus]|nr:hypothetical protein SAMN02910355_1526 [Terrisporobacter glycolicus]